MKQFLSFVLVGAFISATAQEHQTSTVPYQGGELTFQYYEKDGVKVPDGPMSFSNKRYTEKGSQKDGLREGEWIFSVKSGSRLLAEAICNYHEGLLEGKTIYKTANSKDPKAFDVAEYNFHKGHLIGENIIIGVLDTVYCNFDEKGNKVGKWKVAKRGGTSFIEFDDSHPDGGIAYTVDILGQQEEQEFNVALHNIFLPFMHFGNQFTQEPFSVKRETRVILPTLCENKYGFCDPLQPIEK